MIHAPHLRDNKLFDPNERDNCNEPYIYAREWFRQHGYELMTSDDHSLDGCAGVLFWESISMEAPRGLTGLAYRMKNRLLGRPFHRDMYGECRRAELAEHSALIIWENAAIRAANWDPSLHMLFPKVLTWNDDLVDGGRFLKYLWPQNSTYPTVPIIPFGNRRMLVNISMNKVASHPREMYSAREAMIRYFDDACPDDFDLYGYGWDAPPLGRDRADWRPFATYRGRLDNKREALPRYRFAICFENLRDESGYVTEKIFDAMRAGCVPIYRGASNIDEYVDPEAFIDRRRFESDDELRRFLVDVSEPDFRRYQSAMSDYLASERFARFLPEAFAERLFTALQL